MLEDYAVLYFGSAIFKIVRLLFIALLCVHFFACIYYRVKRDTTPNTDDVEAFYQSRYVEPNVSRGMRPCSRLGREFLSRVFLSRVFPWCRIFPAPMSVPLPNRSASLPSAVGAHLTARTCPRAVAAYLLLLHTHDVHDRRIW
jgi:hypothetical protein